MIFCRVTCSEIIKGPIVEKKIRAYLDRNFNHYKCHFYYYNGKHLFALYEDLTAKESNMVMINFPPSRLIKSQVLIDDKIANLPIFPYEVDVKYTPQQIVSKLVVGVKFTYKKNKSLMIKSTTEANGYYHELNLMNINGEAWTGSLKLIKPTEELNSNTRIESATKPPNKKQQ